MGLGRKRLELSPEALLDAARQRPHVGTAEPTRQLRRDQSPRQLHQRQRVAPCLGDDPVPHTLVEPTRDHRVQQGAGIGVAQARDHKLRKPRQLLVFAGLTHREHHGDRFRQEAARDERKRLRRGPVEPLCIIDQADERPLLGRLGQQSERRQTDQEAVRRLPGAQAECRAQRVALRPGQARQAAQHRRAELMQAGERDLHLGLDARRSRDATPRRPLLQVAPAARSCRRPLRHAGPGRWLWPSRTPISSRSSVSHSLRRPRNPCSTSGWGMTTALFRRDRPTTTSGLLAQRYRPPDARGLGTSTEATSLSPARPSRRPREGP